MGRTSREVFAFCPFPRSGRGDGTVHSILIPASLLRPRAGSVVSVARVRVQLLTGELALPDHIEAELVLGGEPIAARTGGTRWSIPAEPANTSGVLRLAIVHDGLEYRDSYPVSVR
jgi:hypothetical protein